MERSDGLEGDGLTPDDQVPSPEEQARAFFRAGGVVLSDEPPQPGFHRHRTMIAIATAAVLVVAAVAIGIGISSRKSDTPVKAAQHRDTTTTVNTTTTTTTTTTTVPLLPNSAVTVQVLNASGSGNLATDTAASLKTLGFTVSTINNAPSVIATGQPSDIFYGTTGLPAAHTLADVLNGPVSFVPDSSLTGNDVSLWIANAQLTVTTTTTTTGVP